MNGVSLMIPSYRTYVTSVEKKQQCNNERPHKQERGDVNSRVGNVPAVYLEATDMGVNGAISLFDSSTYLTDRPILETDADICAL